MKRYIYRFFALLTTVLGAWTFAGCADDGETFMTEESGCFKLVVTVPNESPTRADEYKPTAEELGFNEFKVKTLHFYFYNDATSASVYDCVWNEEEFDTQKEITVQLPSSAFLEGGIFGATSTECIVYAVANVDETTLPEGVTLPEGTAKTIAELKALGITSSFAETKKQDSFVMDGQTTATLDRKERKATGTITLERAAAKITLSIDVPTTITVTGATGDIEYRPNTESMHVWIDNGVKDSKLNTAAEPVTNAKYLYSNTMEATDGKGSAFTKNDAAEKYKYVQNVPFYSYPNKWEATSPAGNCYLTLVLPWEYTDAENNKQQITTYYRIPVHPKECTIERNKHYDIRVTIGRLGSTEPQKPIDMESAWTYVMEWQPQTLETDIKEIRYLLLNNNYYDSTIKNPDGTTGAYYFEMNNTTNIDIPFGTSHEVMIESVNLWWYDCSVNPVVRRNLELTTNGTYKYSSLDLYNSSTDFTGIIIDNAESKLKLKREMLHIGYGEYKWVEEYEQVVEAGTGSEHTITIKAHDEWVAGDTPNITKYAAINAYTFDIVLSHNDVESGKARKAYVRITQYPEIYIRAQLTPDGTRFVNNNYAVIRKDQDPPTYAYTSSTRPSNGAVKDEDHWEYFMGDLWENGNNKNTYIISISKFSGSNNDSGENPEENPEEKPEENPVYIIADPRVRIVNNFPILDSDNPDSSNDTELSPARWSVKDNQGRGRSMENYYPTDDRATKARYIAPKLRVASQWGMSRPMTFEGAKRRCASYQENGRPAGRWRLPTIAEVEYIARLSSKGFIPYLFGDPTKQAGTYFCGSGVVTVDNRRDNPTVTSSTTPFDNTVTGNVRCVYDEWYWGNDTLTVKNQFTWGDRARTTSGN